MRLRYNRPLVGFLMGKTHSLAKQGGTASLRIARPCREFLFQHMKRGIFAGAFFIDFLYKGDTYEQ